MVMFLGNNNINMSIIKTVDNLAAKNLKNLNLSIYSILTR